MALVVVFGLVSLIMTSHTPSIAPPFVQKLSSLLIGSSRITSTASYVTNDAAFGTPTSSRIAAALAVARRAMSSELQSPPRLVVCLMVRDNAVQMREWLLFHAAVGFDHFYIYDDNSNPPLSETDAFRGLENLVTIRPWYELHRDKFFKTGHNHTYRQLLAYRDCGAELADTNTLLSMFDIDEYVWPCDPLVPITVVVRRAAVERAILRCPRYGPTSNYDARLPLVAQNVYRVPFGPLGDPETAIMRSIPDCMIEGKHEGRPCFSHRPKNIYDMTRLSAKAIKWLSIHGVEERHGNVNVTSATVTGTRAHGVCCNHYFLLDAKDLARKVEINANDFYSQFAASASIRGYYNHTRDAVAADRFTVLMEELKAL